MSPPREWKRVKTGLTADYTILKIREDTVADPREGAEHPRVIIESSDWVNIIAYTLDEQVVLIRQFRFGIWQNTLEIPGGMVDPGEDPADAALRELEEETGFVPSKMVPLGFIHPNPALQTNRCHLFLALGCDAAGERHLDAGEDIEVVLTPRARIPDLLRNGEITHALVLAAFMKERLYWDKETSYTD
ncbi:MAG: NUDIX hydrolase [Myxococcaceae bacterium]|nr:NUDIX hydrolase [Myxococcaceae bacterium]